MENEEIITAVLTRLADKLDKVDEKVTSIAIEQAKASVVLESDIPEIKEDLRQHKEGVIQNRARVQILEDLADDHQEILQDIKKFHQDINPVIEHVNFMRKIKDKVLKNIKAKLLAVFTGSLMAIGWKWSQEILELILKAF